MWKKSKNAINSPAGRFSRRSSSSISMGWNRRAAFVFDVHVHKTMTKSSKIDFMNENTENRCDLLAIFLRVIFFFSFRFTSRDLLEYRTLISNWFISYYRCRFEEFCVVRINWSLSSFANTDAGILNNNFHSLRMRLSELMNLLLTTSVFILILTVDVDEKRMNEIRIQLRARHNIAHQSFTFTWHDAIM